MNQPKPSNESVSRRRLFAGAGAAGALGAVATLLPGLRQPAVGVVATTKAAPVNGGGYTVSEHVKRYYQSALI